MGGQKGIALFNKYFSKHVKLICVTTKKNDAKFAEGYDVKPILSDSPFRYIDLFYFFKIRKIIKNFSASHILIEHPYYGWLGWMLKSFSGVKLVVHSHNIEGLRWKDLGKWWWKILWWYERWTHRQADKNLFIQNKDLQYAIKNFRLDPKKCQVMTYGIDWPHKPDKESIDQARSFIARVHAIAEDYKILLFNGAFDYAPNREALKTLIEKINPALARKTTFKYKLVICGRSIPENMNIASHPNIINAGFVEDISVYFRAADVFVNPVVEGGGIKTKLVEALGNNCNAVSTESGAVGVSPLICNGKLFTVPDQDWEQFADKVLEASEQKTDIGEEYFRHFFWGYSTASAAEFIQSTL